MVAKTKIIIRGFFFFFCQKHDLAAIWHKYIHYDYEHAFSRTSGLMYTNTKPSAVNSATSCHVSPLTLTDPVVYSHRPR